jgi:hypothetical protein
VDAAAAAWRADVHSLIFSDPSELKLRNEQAGVAGTNGWLDWPKACQSRSCRRLTVI